MINKFSILNGAKYFSSAIFQNYLVFIPAKNYTKYFSGTTKIDSSKSNGMSEENIRNRTKSHTLSPWLRNLNTDFTLTNCLFGSVKLTKNADSDKYRYDSGYGIGFDSRSEFLFTDGRGSLNFFSFDFNHVHTIDIHKYLMKKT